MAHRLSRILEHLQGSQTGADREVERLRVIYDIKSSLHISVHKLNQIVVHFIGDMVSGLNGAPSDFKMLPSFVYRGDTNVSGKYMALDLGGTNFRVILCTIENGRKVEEEQKKFTIPKPLMSRSSTGKELFDFIAHSVKDFLDSTQEAGAEKLPLGFTFSFPVLQTGIDCGALINWTKGFATPGVEGKDVVGLLSEAFTRAGLKIKVSALVNDTVGTLVTGYFEDSAAQIGVIVGTGSNACYWEDVLQIKKLPSPAGWKGGEQRMCINMEWGNFDSSNTRVLPVTEFDAEIDRASPNRGKQRFEKMISGMYLGEIARQVLLRLVRHGVLPTIPSNVAPMSFGSEHLSVVVGDESPGFEETRALFKQLYKYTVTAEDAEMLKTVFSEIVERSARLSAAGVAAILLKTGKVDGATVCIDGSIFEKMPGYPERMKRSLDDILATHGHYEHGVKLRLTGSGSGTGAAFIAALTENSMPNPKL